MKYIYPCLYTSGKYRYRDYNTESFYNRAIITAEYIYMHELLQCSIDSFNIRSYLQILYLEGMKTIPTDIIGNDDHTKKLVYKYYSPTDRCKKTKNYRISLEEASKDIDDRIGFFYVKDSVNNHCYTCKSLTETKNYIFEYSYVDIINPIDPIGIKCIDTNGDIVNFEYHFSNVINKVGFLNIGSIIKKYMVWDSSKPSNNWKEFNNNLEVLEIYNIREKCDNEDIIITNKILPFEIENTKLLYKVPQDLHPISKIRSYDYYIDDIDALIGMRKYYKWLNDHNMIKYDSFCDIEEILKSDFSMNIKTFDKSLNIINDNDKSIKEKADNNINNKSCMKGIFSNLMEKYKSMLVPVTDPRLKITMDGNVAVKNNEGEYVTIKENNEIVSYPADFTIDVPIYIIKKPFSAVSVGELIRKDNTYVKVIGKNNDGSLKCLSFTGYTTNKKGVTDFMLGTSYAEVIVNIMNIQNSGINPMMLAMINGESNMKDLMMYSMMTGNTAGMNPMMMAMFLSDKDGDPKSSMSKMMEMMMMMQMMNGNNQNMCNPFTSMFGGNTAFNPFNAFKDMMSQVDTNPGNTKNPGPSETSETDSTL